MVHGMGFVDFNHNLHIRGLMFRKGALYPVRTTNDLIYRELDTEQRATYLNPPPIELIGAETYIDKFVPGAGRIPTLRGLYIGSWSLTVIDRHGNRWYAASDRKKQLLKFQLAIHRYARRDYRKTVKAAKSG